MANKKTKGQTIIYKELHIEL